jgi:hypothetical protein
MRTDTCYCRNIECQFFGLVGQQARLVFRDWHDGALRFRCTHCDHLVGARTGTAYTGIRTDESIYQSGARHSAEGTSIRATGRLLSLDKDTICHWLSRLGEHCNRVMSYLFRDLHLSREACQLDELWTFILALTHESNDCPGLQSELAGRMWMMDVRIVRLAMPLEKHVGLMRSMKCKDI